MNKKITITLLVMSLLIPNTGSNALESYEIEKPTLVIMDTAIDTTIKQFKGKIAQEVCILEWKTCPNGDYFMEGEGAATISPYAMTKNGFDHGTKMASAALITNPNMKIVFIRIAGQDYNYNRQSTTEATVLNSLVWVYLNKDKYNIKAISMSQGSHRFRSIEKYCPDSPETQGMIEVLGLAGIPTFMAAGNNRDYRRVDWPSCIPEAISIGAGSKDGIKIYSNHDPLLIDYIAEGTLNVSTPGEIIQNVTGTSIATQVAGASWVAIKQSKPNLSYQEIVAILDKTSKPIKGKQGYGKFINLKEALIG
jgi:hypothetical protein